MKLYLIECANTPIINHECADQDSCSFQCVQAKDSTELHKICANMYNNTEFQNIIPINNMDIIQSIRDNLNYETTEEVLSDIIENLLGMLKREERQHKEIEEKYNDLILRIEQFTLEYERF